jgi:hypothetical protein
MKSHQQSSGLKHGLSFIIDGTWTPEQALAVYELLDDLREGIWLTYAHQIQTLLEQQRSTGDDAPTMTDDPPF